MNRETRKILIAARKLVRKGWTQGCSARDAAGGGVSPHYSNACEWCITGAIESAGYHKLFSKIDAIEVLAAALPGRARNWNASSSLQVYNDRKRRKKEDVLALFDRVLAK